MKADYSPAVAIKMGTIYIAGPMTGLPDFNFPEFDRTAEWLRSIGFCVISPAEHDREMGIDMENPPSLEQLKEAIMWDLQQVADSGAVYFMRGWENSKGARAEHALAVFLGKDLWYA
jgi:hypothetical protein